MKRVFIVSCDSMFGHGVRKLIGEQAHLEIVGAETDATRAVGLIGELRPDVVILEQGDASDLLAETVMSLRQLVSTRVVELSLHTNSIACYSVEKRTVQRVDDLLEAIG